MRLTPRQTAERLYAQAFEDVQSGKDALKEGKDKAALKKFGKALEHSSDAVKLDSTYYQAWNLVAFCQRKTGHLEPAFDAYARCLKLSPEYEIAHEYRGEAYLMADSLGRAQEELLWLRKRASEYREELATAIADYEKAHPGSASSEKASPGPTGGPQAAGGPADSAATAGVGKKP